MENCFANIKGKCDITTEGRTRPKCKGECSFYKTKQQAYDDRKSAIERIKKLPEEKFRYINQKHYNGKLRRDEA